MSPVSLGTGKKDVHTPEFMDFLNSLVLDDVAVAQGLNERLTALLTALKKSKAIFPYCPYPDQGRGFFLLKNQYQREE